MGLEINNPENTLDQELRARQTKAVDNAYDLIDKQMDWSIRHLGDMGKQVTSELKHLYQVKADELRKEAVKLHGDLNDQEIYALQESLSESIAQRFSLMLEISGGKGVDDTVSTPEELESLRRTGMTVIANTDVEGLIHSYLTAHEATHPGAAARYEATLGGSIRPDTFDLLKKAEGGSEPMNEKDWAVMTDYMHKLYNKDLVGTERTVGISLMKALQPGQRMDLLDHMAADPILPKMLIDMVKANYVQIDQAKDFLKTHPELVQKNPDLMTKLNDPKVKETQEKIAKAALEAPNRIARQMTVGSRNSTQELTTFQGIGSTLLAANGVMTVMANVMMEITDPASLVENPMLYAGLAQAVGGMELSKGVGGTMTQPTNLVAGLLTDKDESKDDATKLEREAFAREFGNHDLQAQFYYSFAPEIVDAYKEKVKASTSTRPQLTVEDLGIDWKDVPAPYNTESKQSFETQLSKWAGDFAVTWKIKEAGTEKGGERWYMDELRKSRGYHEGYSIDPKLTKIARKNKTNV